MNILSTLTPPPRFGGSASKRLLTTLAAALAALVVAAPVAAQGYNPDPGKITMHSAGGRIEGCSGSETRIRVRLGGQRFLGDGKMTTVMPTVRLTAGSKNGIIQFRQNSGGRIDTVWQDGPITLELEPGDNIVRVQNKPGLNQGGKHRVRYSIENATAAMTTWDVQTYCSPDKVGEAQFRGLSGNWGNLPTGVTRTARRCDPIPNNLNGTATWTFEDTRTPALGPQTAFVLSANRSGVSHAPPWAQWMFNTPAPGC